MGKNKKKKKNFLEELFDSKGSTSSRRDREIDDLRRRSEDFQKDCDRRSKRDRALSDDG